MTATLDTPAHGSPRPSAGSVSGLDRHLATVRPSAAESSARVVSTTVLDLVVPVYNEELALAPSVTRLHEFLTHNLPFSFRITIADNASTDATWIIANRLAEELPAVRAVHLAEKGRGRALRAVWSTSDAMVLGYTDVDLSTDLAALLPMVGALVAGHSDVAIGSRLASGARVTRGPKREFISRSYNLLLRTTLRARFRDAQCGFKFIRSDAARALLPVVADEGWFFDTELLVLAERSGMRILEIPVDWIDDPDSRVDIVATAVADLKGILRVGRGLVSGRLSSRLPVRAQTSVPKPVLATRTGAQLVRFACVGVLSTLAYIGLYWILRGVTGPLPANFIALLVTALANTAANRRFTFGVRGSRHIGRHHTIGLAAFAIGLGLTSGGLTLLHALVEHPARGLEIAVLVVANAIATLIRFVLLRAAVGASKPVRV